MLRQEFKMLMRGDQTNVLEEIKRDIIASRTRANQTFEEQLIQDIKRKHKEWLEGMSLDPTQVDGSYNILITDHSIQSPFMINADLIRIIRANTRQSFSKEQRAKAIYDWIEHNIEYGKIGDPKSYINSGDVLNQKRGICAEMAFLYIAMARSVGLRSNFVSVDKDYRKKRVNHACAAVELEGRLMQENPVLVDPAYHIYDAQHRKYRVWQDKEIMGVFGTLRGKNG